MEVDDVISPESSYYCGPINTNETIINLSSTSEDDTDSSTVEHEDELKYLAWRKREREHYAHLVQGTTKDTKEPEKSLIVYTTRLERMSFMNKSITGANVSQLLQNINDESKPKRTSLKLKRKRRNKRVFKIFVNNLEQINKILRQNSEESTSVDAPVWTNKQNMNNISTKRKSIQNEFNKYTTCVKNDTEIYFRIQHCHSEVSEVYALNSKKLFNYGQFHIKAFKEKKRKRIVTEYYRIAKEIMFPVLDSRIISIEYCCWHDRELKLQIFFDHLQLRLPNFFKKAHACEAACTCCCSGYTSSATIIPSQEKSKKRQNSQTRKYRERISDLINKSSQEGTSSSNIVNRALRFIPNVPINTKPGVKAEASTVKPVPILLKNRNTKECIFYQVGVKRQMETYIRPYVSEEEANIPEDTVLVENKVSCFEKQKLLHKLSLEGVRSRTVIHFLNGHQCAMGNCNCCCESPKNGQDIKVPTYGENNTPVITEEIETTVEPIIDSQTIVFCDDITPISKPITQSVITNCNILSASNTIENPIAISSEGPAQNTNTAKIATTSREVNLPNEVLPTSNFNICSSNNDSLIILPPPNNPIMPYFDSQLNTNNDIIAISQCPIQFTNIDTIVKESNLPNGLLVFPHFSTPDKANNASINHDKLPNVNNVVSNTANKVIASKSNNDTVHKISSIIGSGGRILSNDILSKYKNIRFGIDRSQNLEIIKTYAVSEEDNKILHHLLKRAQKYIDRLKATSSLDSSNFKAYQSSEMLGISMGNIVSRFNGITFGINKSGYVYNISCGTRFWSDEEIIILECIRSLAQKEVDRIKLNNLPYYTILMDLFNNPQNCVTSSKVSISAQNQQSKILNNTNKGKQQQEKLLKRKPSQDRTYKPRSTYDFNNTGRIVKSYTFINIIFNKFNRNEPMMNNEIYKCFSKWSNVIRTYSLSKIPVKNRTIPTTNISTQTLSSKIRNPKEKEKETKEKLDEDVIVIDDETEKDIEMERSQKIDNLVINKEISVINHTSTSILSNSHQNSIKNSDHNTTDDFEDFLSSTTILKVKERVDRRGRKRRLVEIPEECIHMKHINILCIPPTGGVNQTPPITNNQSISTVDTKPKTFNTNSPTHTANLQAEQEPLQTLPNISKVSGDSALPMNELSQQIISTRQSIYRPSCIISNPNPSKTINSKSPLAKFLSSPVVPSNITETGIVIIHDDVESVL